MAERLDQTAIALEAAALRLDEKRNGPDVRERFHGIFFARASGDSVDSLPAGHRLYALRRLWRQGFPVFVVVGFFLFGILLWTLTEYLIHRYIFHYEPKTRVGKRLHYMIHGVHHDYPNDARRLVMPPSVSVPLAFLFYGMFLLIFGRFASSASPGWCLAMSVTTCSIMRHTISP